MTLEYEMTALWFIRGGGGKVVVFFFMYAQVRKLKCVLLHFISSKGGTSATITVMFSLFQSLKQSLWKMFGKISLACAQKPQMPRKMCMWCDKKIYPCIRMLLFVMTPLPFSQCHYLLMRFLCGQQCSSTMFPLHEEKCKSTYGVRYS